VDVGQLHTDPPGDHHLLAARVDEQQVFLAVVEEAKVARRCGCARGPLDQRCRRPADADELPQLRGVVGAATPWRPMNVLTRSRVSGVMRAPSRRRATSLPSFTARRPKVDSAIALRRQNSAIVSSNPPAGSAAVSMPFLLSSR